MPKELSRRELIRTITAGGLVVAGTMTPLQVVQAIDDPDVAQAVRLIRDSACSGIDVSRVANGVGLSRRALERRIRLCLGRSPKAEIMRVRIERAKMLMFQTDETSESIARNSGFSSLEYFTRVFRRMVGMKPQMYRKMRRISRDLGKTTEH